MEQPAYIPDYTVDDYEQWEGDWELWDGLPVAMSPSPRRDHQAVVKNLLLMIQQQFLAKGDACRCDVFSDLDWRVNRKTVLRPDVSVVCDENEATDFIEKPPVVAVEVVSPSNRPQDLERKRQLYKRERVKFYVEINTFDRTIEVSRHDGNGCEAGGFPLDLHDGCGIDLDEESLWRGTMKIRRM